MAKDRAHDPKRVVQVHSNPASGPYAGHLGNEMLKMYSGDWYQTERASGIESKNEKARSEGKTPVVKVQSN